MSVVWANRLRHKDLDLPNERVYGPDLFLDVFQLGHELGLPHYLLGSTPEVLADLESELQRGSRPCRLSGQSRRHSET